MQGVTVLTRFRLLFDMPRLFGTVDRREVDIFVRFLFTGGPG